MPFRKGIESYAGYLRNKGTTEATIGTYMYVFSKFRTLMDVRIADISPERMSAEFSAAFGDSAPGYYNSARTVVKSLFNYFVNILEAVPRNPMRKLSKRKAAGKERKF